MSKMGLYKKLGALVSTLLMGASLGGNFHSFAMKEPEEDEYVEDEYVKDEDVKPFEISFKEFYGKNAKDFYGIGCAGITYNKSAVELKGLKNTDPAIATLGLMYKDGRTAVLKVEGTFSDFCSHKLGGTDMFAQKVKELNEGLKALNQTEQNIVVENDEQPIQELNNESKALQKKERETENHNVDNPVEVRSNKAGLQKQVDVLGNQDGSNISNYLPKVGAGTLISAVTLYYLLG